MEKEIRNILKRLGVNPSLLGYKYWITAVFYAVKNQKYTMNDVYTYVAKKHRTSYSKAERALRYAMNEANVEILDYKNKLTNSSLLAILVEKFM